MPKLSVRAIIGLKFIGLAVKRGLLTAASLYLMGNLTACSDADTSLSPPQINRDLLAKVIARALSKGGDYADV